MIDNPVVPLPVTSRSALETGHAENGHPTGSRSLTGDSAPFNSNEESFAIAASGALERVSTFGVVKAVDDLVDPLWTSPYLQNAMQVLENVSEIGRTLPFVAPAFMLFKIIIEIERRAKEADLKCKDLVERITFMLSHLTVLKNIDVMDSTKVIVERMNTALRAATALIEAYRKQGALARRLNNNRDKFTKCALDINNCANDLMFSLQIQQTSQLDIITRAVPTDPTDEAAQIFLAKHGSLENVKEHPELVEEFARRHHLTVDDNVMEQLNTNITDVIQQNQRKLEEILKDNVGAAVVDGIKALAAHMDEAEMEQKFICIQCSKEYRNSLNGEKSCSFHKAPYDSWSKRFDCCGTMNPCEFNYHRSRHHSDYPYGDFFKFAWGIFNYVDTTDTWAEVKDTNLETNEEPNASAGQMLRWASRAARISEPTIFVKVGSIQYTKPYFFDTFTGSELESMSNVLSFTGQTLIFRTSEDSDEFAMAEWIFSGGMITGVRLTAKAATSDAPFIKVCNFDISTGKKTGEAQAPSEGGKKGEVLTLSEGGFKSYTPKSDYILPETIRVGPELTDVPVREVRKDFKTRAAHEFPVIMKVMSDPPIAANPQFASLEADNFEGEISVFNNHPAGSPNPITISAISALFRLIGDDEYKPVNSFELQHSSLPVTIEPKQSWNFRFATRVPRPQQDVALGIKWWNRAVIARHRPLRLKITLEDITGEQASLVTEYVFKPYQLKPKKDEEIAFFYFGDYDRQDRYEIRVTKGSEDTIISIDGNSITTKQLEKIAYNACKSGETEVDLKIGQERLDGLWEWKAWAMVDLSCRRVYAIKVLMQEGKLVNKKRLGCLGYVPVPLYGDVCGETRPIRYAVESAKLPELEPWSLPDYPNDDDFDKFVPEPPKPVQVAPSAEGGSGGGTLVVPQELVERLTSIDSSLARIAAALEMLVASKT